MIVDADLKHTMPAQLVALGKALPQRAGVGDRVHHFTPCLADWAMLIKTSRNAGGVALRMRVLSLPPTIAIIPMRRALA